MESDLRSLRASGGAHPKADRVVVGKPLPEAPRKSFFAARNIEAKWLLLAGAAAVGLGAVLVYAWFRLSLPTFPSTSSGQVPLASEEAAVVGEEVGGGEFAGEALSADAGLPAGKAGSLELALPEAQAPSIPARGIFRKPADRTVAFATAASVASVTELKTPLQRLQEALAAVPAPATSTLLEVVPSDANGARLALPAFLALMDLHVLPPEFWSARFADRFGMFVYREKQQSWPGYILALRPGENWLFLKEEASALEKSPKLANFFLSAPGEPKGEFEDSRVGDVAVRSLEWSSAPAKFLYGWFRGYLVLSTSREGLEAVLPRL
jgi:hypothetical protein